MQIDILLQDPRGDEIGVVKLEAVRLAAAGVESAPPDLSGQMAQLIARLGDTLTGLGFSPVLDPLGVRIAVSRALLDAQPSGVRIPLQVNPVKVNPVSGGGTATGAHEKTPTPEDGLGFPTTGPTADGPASDEWQGLFELGTQETAGLNGQGPAAPGSPGIADQTASREPFDQWTELGEMWGLGEEGDEL